MDNRRVNANEDVIRRLFEATNGKDVDAIAALYASGFKQR